MKKRNDINTRIERLGKRIDQVHGKYRRLLDLYRKLKAERVGLKGKYIKYSQFGGDDTDPVYMYVTETFRSQDQFIIRGCGFTYYYTDYADLNFAHYSAFYDITFNIELIHDLDKEIDKTIEIIDRETFLQKAKEMTDNLYDNLESFTKTE